MVPPENSQSLLHKNAVSQTVYLSALLPESWGGWGGVSCDLLAPWSYESWDSQGKRSGEGHTSPVFLPSYTEPLLLE